MGAGDVHSCTEATSSMTSKSEAKETEGAREDDTGSAAAGEGSPVGAVRLESKAGVDRETTNAIGV